MMESDTINTYNLTCTALNGTDSCKILSNPDRGLRMENHFNPYNCSGFPQTQANMNGFELLINNISKYTPEQPRLTQLYIYLIDYYNCDLDQKALNNIKKYFNLLKENNLKALLVFAYEYDEKIKKGPTTNQILSHIQQLKPLLNEYHNIIHCVQAGFIGLWGEWHHPVHPHSKKKILDSILNAVPDDLYVQVRMVGFKNILNKTDKRRNRVGYADLYLVGDDHRWSISLFPGTEEYNQVYKECSNLLIDGEMPWGADTTEVKNIDGLLMAKRLKAQHFTSLSLEHNYRESGYFSNYAMRRWQLQKVSPRILKDNNLTYAPNWFKNKYNKSINRTLFEYIRDYLGYLIMLTNGNVTVDKEIIEVNLELLNYGFAAPLGMSSIQVVLLNDKNKIIKSQEICKMNDLQPEIKICKSFKFIREMPNTNFGLGIVFKNYGGTPAKLYNDIPFLDGVNKIY